MVMLVMVVIMIHIIITIIINITMLRMMILKIIIAITIKQYQHPEVDLPKETLVTKEWKICKNWSMRDACIESPSGFSVPIGRLFKQYHPPPVPTYTGTDLPPEAIHE
eukprot:10384078-Lingulodinium_polyedra.AAC.1